MVSDGTGATLFLELIDVIDSLFLMPLSAALLEAGAVGGSSFLAKSNKLWK